MHLTEGTVVAGHYKLLKHIGQGSFGDVWLAHNELADIDVAIKFYGSLDEQGLEDLRNEFKIAYRLNHPNLLNINHFDVTSGNCPFLVMPYCANGSVRRLTGRMQESEIWKFVHDVSSGLAFLHGQYPPIVHQDIKPDNILITTDGHYVISDFGISRSLQTRMSRTMNKNFSSSGTIAYMGPERFSEEPKIILASDIWALGMTIYEVVTGDVLWEGMGGCVQLNGARIPVIDYNRFSAELNHLVQACLNADTRLRPTAAEVAEYASCWLEHRSLPALHGQQQALGLSSVSTKGMQEPVCPVQSVSPAYHPSSSYTSSYYYEGNRPKPDDTNKSNKLSLFSSFNTERLAIGTLLFLVVVAVCAGLYIFIDLNREATVTPQAPVKTEMTVTPVQSQSQTPLSNKGQALELQEVEYVSAPVQATTSTKKMRTQTTPTNTPPRQTGGKTDDDRLFFQCKTAADYNLYLSRFPNGRHAAEARKKLKDFQQRYEQINRALPAGSRRSHKTLN